MSVLHLPCRTGEISDGYHTFDELYEHRGRLFIALMKSHAEISWISHKHNDGTMVEGWFIAGIDLPTGPVTYHMRNGLWGLAVHAHIPEVPRAPKWDGHSSSDVLQRLGKWICPQLYPSART